MRYVCRLAVAIAAFGVLVACGDGQFAATSGGADRDFSDAAQLPAATPASGVPTATSPSALSFLGTGFTRGNGPGTPTNTYFAFADTPRDCLPIYPVTIIWRAKPEPKTGYYSTFFWGNDGKFRWKNGMPDSYWGAHPYPDTGSGNFNLQHWEIATDFGGDIIETMGGTRKALVTGTWYLQGFRAWRANSGRKIHRFYIDLPSMESNSIIEAQVDSSFGNVNPPNPALVWGGAPWGSEFGNDETYRGLIRGIQIYNDLLTEKDMLREARVPLSTPAGRSSIWYLKMNPMLHDMRSDVESGPHGSCGRIRREPVLRVDGRDVNPGEARDREAIKVKSHLGS